MRSGSVERNVVMRIAEVAQKFAISPDTLRYYERMGLLGPIARTTSGVRDYSEADCNRIEFVKCMRGANVSIEALATSGAKKKRPRSRSGMT